MSDRIDTKLSDRGEQFRIKGEFCKIGIALLSLFLPSLIMIFALHGLRDHYLTFHSGDEEVYHYPVIIEFMRTFPMMKIWDYNSATTPLFHMVAATAGKIFGSYLSTLRILNVLSTYLFSVVIFLLFYRTKEVDFLTSLLISLTLTLSPYVFGASFILLTDNLAILFASLSILFAQKYLNAEEWESLAISALFASWAILTRQIYIWLLPVIFFAWAMVERPTSTRQLLGVLALLALSIVPYFLLCVSWGGLNPPLFQQFHALNPNAIGFLTACIGLYGAPLLIAAAKNTSWRQMLKSGWPFLVITGTTTLVILLLAPLRYVNSIDCEKTVGCLFPTDGYLWKLSLLFPSLANSSLLFWILIPLGVATILFAWQRDRWRSMPVLIYLTFGVLAMGIVSPFQKYYDSVAILICFLIFFQKDRYRRRESQIILLGYCASFALYATIKL